MPSKQRQPSTQLSSVFPVPMTILHRLPPNSQQQLAHLIADLIQRVRTATAHKERNDEC
jgi:hypothetical protein